MALDAFEAHDSITFVINEQDAAEDLYKRNAAGLVEALHIGNEGQQLSVIDGKLAWKDPVSVYTLSKATTTLLGGIIVGNNLSIDADGVLSALSGYSDVQARSAISLTNGLTYDATTGIGVLGGTLLQDTYIDYTNYNLFFKDSLNSGNYFNITKYAFDFWYNIPGGGGDVGIDINAANTGNPYVYLEAYKTNADGSYYMGWSAMNTYYNNANYNLTLQSYDGISQNQATSFYLTPTSVSLGAGNNTANLQGLYINTDITNPLVGNIRFTEYASTRSDGATTKAIYVGSDGYLKYGTITIPSSYILPAATTTALGGIIVGSGLSVAANGTLSVTTPASNVASITLNMGGIIHATPVNFSNSGGAWSGTTTYNTQTANTFFAGPASGAAAVPSFRAMVAADVASGSGNYIQNQYTAGQSANMWITGNGRFGGDVVIYNGGSSGNLTIGNAFSGGTVLTVQGSTSGSIFTSIGTYQFKINTYNALQIFSSGRIGIGTAGVDNGTLFQVNGGITTGSLIGIPIPAGVPNNAGGGLTIAAPASTGSTGSLPIIFQTASAGATGTTVNPLVTRMSIDGAGNVILNNGTALVLGNVATDPTGSNGMTIYNTTSGQFDGYRAGVWKSFLMTGDVTASNGLTATGNSHVLGGLLTQSTTIWGDNTGNGGTAFPLTIQSQQSNSRFNYYTWTWSGGQLSVTPKSGNVSDGTGTPAIYINFGSTTPLNNAKLGIYSSINNQSYSIGNPYAGRFDYALATIPNYGNNAGAIYANMTMTGSGYGINGYAVYANATLSGTGANNTNYAFYGANGYNYFNGNTGYLTLPTLGNAISVGGSLQGSAGSAKGVYINSTLTPSSINNTLVGFDIATTFGTGSITAIATLGSLVTGTGYAATNTYTNVPLTGGTGSGATANITVSGTGVTGVTLLNGGTGYTVGDVLSAANSNLGNSGSGFSIPVTSLGSTGTVKYALRINDMMGFGNIATEPTGINGMMYYSTALSKFRAFENGAWVNVIGGSGSSTYTLPIASSTVLGGIKVGSGLSIDGSGVLTASSTVYSFTNSSIINTTGNLTLSGDSSTPGNSMLYGTNASGVKGWYAQPSGGSAYTLPIASSAVLGGIKVGSGLSIDGTGILSATAGSGEANTASNLGGSGVGLYSTKVGVDLRFKSLYAGNNISFSDDGTYVTINSTAISFQELTLSTTGAATANGLLRAPVVAEGGIITVDVAGIDSSGNYVVRGSRKVSYLYNISGVISIKEINTIYATTTDSALNGADYTFITGTSDIRVQVTGVATRNIYWKISWKTTFINTAGT